MNDYLPVNINEHSKQRQKLPS